MAITLMNDPIMALEDAKSLLNITDDTQARVLVNALTMKFRHHTGRIQLGTDASNDVVEYLRGDTPCTLYLHCSPLLTDQDIIVEIFDGHNVVETYKWSEEEVIYYGDDQEARLESAGLFPTKGDPYTAKITYRGGWTATPGDVLEGAILQGRVDLLRQNGEIGVDSRSVDGESTSYDTKGIIKTVAELWGPYRILV
jgi:hypothetical protein